MNLHALDVPGGTARHLLIGRILDLAAGVSGNRLDDTGNVLEVGLHAPEAPAGEGGNGQLLVGRLGYLRLLVAGVGN